MNNIIGLTYIKKREEGKRLYNIYRNSIYIYIHMQVVYNTISDVLFFCFLVMINIYVCNGFVTQ